MVEGSLYFNIANSNCSFCFPSFSQQAKSTTWKKICTLQKLFDIYQNPSAHFGLLADINNDNRYTKGLLVFFLELTYISILNNVQIYL